MYYFENLSTGDYTTHLSSLMLIVRMVETIMKMEMIKTEIEMMMIIKGMTGHFMNLENSEYSEKKAKRR
jgi:hypothetical protein